MVKVRRNKKLTMKELLVSKKKGKHIYFIGIKGVGMTMLAQFLKAQGNNVSGSDVSEVFLTDKVLRDNKIKVFSSFNPDNIPLKCDLIVYSSAYNEKNNPELGYIKNNPSLFSEVNLKSYAETLSELFNLYYGISVCGSHGKTTTSAFLGYVLFKSGLQPNVLVGSRVPQFKGSSLIGSSKLFIAETDEYQNKLKFFNPKAVLLNNIDYDHPDFFKTEASYVKVFKDFVKKIPASGFLVVNFDNEKAKKVAKNSLAKIISYSVEEETGGDKYKKEQKGCSSSYFAFNLFNKGVYQYFKVNNLGRFKIKLSGRHNVSNALAVIATCLELKVPLLEIKKNLALFSGAERRAQILGTYQGALFIDDYAHHPTEIKATLKALKKTYPDRRIITVFHPHTFTRTKTLFNDFSESFSDSDELIVLNIYGSAREKQGGTSSALLVKAIQRFNKKSKEDHLKKQVVQNIKTIPEVAKYLQAKCGPKDLVILMGAGDVFRVAEIILNKKAKK